VIFKERRKRIMQYYSYPFQNYDRKAAGMLPTVQPAFPQPQVPLTFKPLEQDEMTQPAMPAAPMSPVMPEMMPGAAMPGMMPVCPYMPFTGYSPDSYGMEGMDTGAGVYDFRQPQPVLSNPPAVTTIVLFKELTGFPNYGNPSGNADILYTGTRGEWTFNVPAFLFVPGNLRAQIVIRAVLDDHSAVPVANYSARIAINGTNVHTGRLPLVHGAPVGGRFNNWRSLTFDISNFRRTNRVVIVNTSTTGPNDWIAFDWMELRLFPR
jgi:hypothetical protein